MQLQFIDTQLTITPEKYTDITM